MTICLKKALRILKKKKVYFIKNTSTIEWVSQSDTLFSTMLNNEREWDVLSQQKKKKKFRKQLRS